jgi:hypothetical protein
LSREIKSEATHPPPCVVRVGRLENCAGILREMATVYRAARRGQITVEAACKFTYMLSCMGRLHEAAELEKRVEALEGRDGAKP